MKKFKHYIILHLILLFYSLGGICSKIAANKEFLSFDFCLFYALVISILGVYALFWQQILKHIPLNVAYVNKSVMLVWGILWGALIFDEKLSAANIIGSLIVLFGVLLMVSGGEKKNE